MEELEELVRRMQQGDHEAFGQIFDRYQHRLLRTAWLILGNHADSEDVVQETFVKCYYNCKNLKKPALFSTWIFQILTRTAWRFGKRKNRETPVEELFDQNQPDWGDSPLEQVLQKELQEDIYRSICKLNPKQRTAVILYYYNQLSTKEISQIMGCFEGTVKSRLYAARRSLEQSLRKEQITWIDENLTF